MSRRPAVMGLMAFAIAFGTVVLSGTRAGDAAPPRSATAAAVSLDPNPLELERGARGSLKLKLARPLGPSQVFLRPTIEPSGVVQVPAGGFRLEPGATQATLDVVGIAVGQATVRITLPAELGGASAVARINVTLPAAGAAQRRAKTIYAVAISPKTASLTVGASMTFTATLNHPAPKDGIMVFAVIPRGMGFISVTSTKALTIPAGEDRATFTIAANRPGGPCVLRVLLPPSHPSSDDAQVFVTAP